MDLKEELKSLVETIKRNSNDTQEQMSVKAGYGETYISECLSPTGKPSKKFIKALKNAYLKSLEFPVKSEKETYSVLLDRAEQATDIVELKAFTKALLHAVAKLQSKVYGMGVNDCLDELVKDTRLNVRDLMEK